MDTGRGGWRARASCEGGTDHCALESVVSLPVRIRKDAVLVAQAAVALDRVGGSVLDGGVRSSRRVLDRRGRGDASSADASRCSKDRASQLHRVRCVRAQESEANEQDEDGRRPHALARSAGSCCCATLSYRFSKDPSAGSQSSRGVVASNGHSLRPPHHCLILYSETVAGRVSKGLLIRQNTDRSQSTRPRRVVANFFLLVETRFQNRDSSPCCQTKSLF